MSQKNLSKFNPDCRDCPRLASFLDQVALKHPDYHARPVAPFGDDNARLLIVGLAPGMHGANASGRPFTGDHAGILLYKTLFEYGFSNQPESVSRDDELELFDCRITNAVKCLPPQNKPQLDEVKQCNHYLRAEIDALPAPAVIIALGKLARGLAGAAYRFAPLAGALFGGLFVGPSCLHLAEYALSLHLFLKNTKGLVDIVVADDNLQWAS